MSSFSTAQICDRYAAVEALQIAEPIFKAYGATRSFFGQISTLKTFEDSDLIEQAVNEFVTNKILVVDGGGFLHSALFDAKLAEQAINHGWVGVLIYGCIRDSAHINQLPIGVRALQTQPLKSTKKNHGERNTALYFGGIHFKSEHYLYVDEDGIIAAKTLLT
ncbi:MAG: ribonuclease E activity regulator RraA [Methylovulum sp.]|jgi:regulator of ribonuclease activity A|nr:ribonuclease E activity regulator RraA [Methylovulum sp.]